ncbi:MAG: ion channel [Aeromonadaceae bacterium]
MLVVLLVGMPVILGNMLLQSQISVWSVRFYLKRINKPLCLPIGSFPLFGVITILMLGNFMQITLWGLLFLLLGEFQSLDAAIYHSGVNFATLGYGDIVMSPKWRLLGPLEAVNGALMIGLSGASMLAVLQHQLKSKFGEQL